VNFRAKFNKNHIFANISLHDDGKEKSCTTQFNDTFRSLFRQVMVKFVFLISLKDVIYN
jgi:hypothetical protein